MSKQDLLKNRVKSKKTAAAEFIEKMNHPASDSVTVDSNSNNESSNTIDNASNDRGPKDAVDALFEGNLPKSMTHTYRGFYLRNDLVKVLDGLSKKGNKGIKSDLVNLALEELFRKKGWMK